MEPSKFITPFGRDSDGYRNAIAKFISLPASPPPADKSGRQVVYFIA